MSYDERLAHMLVVAEQSFGQRTHQRTIMPVRFHTGLPQVIYPTPTEIEVRLPLSHKTDPERCCYMLAHECVHILSPVDGFNTTFLEEGLATSFAHSYILAHSAGDWNHSPEAWSGSGDRRYDIARALVECFLSTRLDAIRRLREREPTISHIGPKLISRMYPDVPDSVARGLTSRFHGDPTMPSQPIWLAPRKAKRADSPDD